MTLNHLIVNANADPNIPVYQEALLYPAVILDWSNPLSANYITSLQAGVTNLANEINDLAATCVGTNIFLAGYSQGADVIDQVIGAYSLAAITVPGLSSGARASIKSVMLFGDPSYRPGEAWDAAGNGTGHGIFEKPSGQFAGSVRYTWLPPNYTTYGPVTNVRSYCFTGDEFCQSNITGGTIHGSYGTSVAGSIAMTDAWAFTFNSILDYN